MTESIHKILQKHPLPHSDVDDILQEITGWLMRNYDYYKDKPLVDKICEDIWESCKEADKG